MSDEVSDLRRKDSLLRMNAESYLFEEQPKLAKQLEEFLDNASRGPASIVVRVRSRPQSRGGRQEKEKKQMSKRHLMYELVFCAVACIPRSAASQDLRVCADGHQSRNCIADAVKQLAERDKNIAHRGVISPADLARVCRIMPSGPLERMTMDQTYCMAYVRGVVDAIIGLGENQMLVADNGVRIRFCIPDGLTTQDAARIFMKYVQDHPEVLNDEAAAVIFLSVGLQFACSN